jgi:hypothetical protein
MRNREMRKAANIECLMLNVEVHTICKSRESAKDAYFSAGVIQPLIQGNVEKRYGAGRTPQRKNQRRCGCATGNKKPK